MRLPDLARSGEWIVGEKEMGIKEGIQIEFSENERCGKGWETKRGWKEIWDSLSQIA